MDTAETVEKGHGGIIADLVDDMATFVHAHSDLLFSALDLPDIPRSMFKRQALVVSAGYNYKEDLAMLKSYIREYRPLLIGVDAGADALLEAGHRPDIIIGNLDAVGDSPLLSGAVLIAHHSPGRPAEGIQRLEKEGLHYDVLKTAGTNEDAGLLLADALGAPLIVAVGSPTVIEYAHAGAESQPSAYVVRMILGSRVVDAKGVSLLYRQRAGSWQLLVLALAGLLALAAALAATESGRLLLELIAAQFDGVLGFFGGWGAQTEAALHTRIAPFIQG
ncbi:putative cytokinetic ring protein SteA [Brevibacterium sp. Marseille-P9724]|uniref:putative cytokinetic ring protein SteA n=1 Tax=Brevibacterium sp. Marseille-P9724 TaxID=2614125 RepID=UPI00125ED868|nr:putative cytokinetic ring protein SteA [Brevibacterium sp. Marseille-P9724]